MCASAMPLLQERFRADGFALAFWNKAFCALWALPFILWQGLPADPVFYAYMAGSALLWCVSDVIYFRSVPIVGAGVITRLIPSAVIMTFILWFFIDPALLNKYLADPVRTAIIVGIITCAAISAMFIKRCAVSWQAVRLLWFVLAAATVGPIIAKLSLQHAQGFNAAVSLLFVQSLLMTIFWSVFYAIKKPVPIDVLLHKTSLQAGGAISVACGAMILFKSYGLMHAEHPAYISVLLFTDAFWVILAYKIMGKKETANVWAGLGIVASAIALVIAKTF